ncbi:permease of the major facilitator superfamily [Pseudovirgaria hyperparasitica]|uniref:Permease of the major facilitator superfamily n=1 Tax=Pseudovirgaria hyperparasitica TaxID=470096 RepID=A0A6A6VUK3_9PEZI|nr:permease of the major facilitator superfamily [Pseudovirgaria hyperparasitica]KAF2753569.1 permease of the major facilitator superfamily [Pseudovirgaria hyperparasitica]
MSIASDLRFDNSYHEDSLDSRTNERTPLRPVPKLTDHQTFVLPRRRLLAIFPALALVQFISFLDQTAIATALPSIALGLGIGQSISWVGTSFLLTSTSTQLVNGRISDIFGRKNCLIIALLVMGFGNLLSGLSQTPIQLYAARAFTGLGAGSINALVQITISDITTLNQRGYYFGIIGISVAFGNGLGPIIGGWLSEVTSWRWAFWFICPLVAIAVSYLALVLPQSTSPENVWQKIRMVDYAGILLTVGGTILFLVPISQGGSTWGWGSPTLIILLTLSGLCFALLVFVERNMAKTPVLPRHVFSCGRSTNTLLAVNLIIGWCFWGNLFSLPLYLQNVRGWSPALAGSYILPLVIAHGITSGLSGVIITRCGHYMPMIVIGTGLWAVAAIVKAFTYNRETPIWLLCVIGIFEGIGVGSCLQPVLIGLLAGSRNEDRAVITVIRNFLRDMGGSIGITVSGAILNSVLLSQLHGKFSAQLIKRLISSAFSLIDLNTSRQENDQILTAYTRAIQSIFVSYAVLISALFLLSLTIEDYGLHGRL